MQMRTFPHRRRRQGMGDASFLLATANALEPLAPVIAPVVNAIEGSSWAQPAWNSLDQAFCQGDIDCQLNLVGGLLLGGTILGAVLLVRLLKGGR